MPLTTAQMVRGRLNDPWRRGSEVVYGDGTGSAFQLREGSHAGTTLISGTASIIGMAGWSATGCTFDTVLGYVTFSGRISAGSAVRFDYQYAVFSEDDIGYFTGLGSVAAAAKEGVMWLMGDAWKRARWAAPDGTTYDDSRAQDNLTKLYDRLLSETQEEGGPAGGLESWSVEQGNY